MGVYQEHPGVPLGGTWECWGILGAPKGAAGGTWACWGHPRVQQEGPGCAGAPQGAGGWGCRRAGDIWSTQGCSWRDLGALGAPQGAAGAGRIQDDAGQQPVVVAPVPDLVELPRGDGGALLVLPQRVQLCGAGGGVRSVGTPPRGPRPHPKNPRAPPVAHP